MVERSEEPSRVFSEAPTLDLSSPPFSLKMKKIIMKMKSNDEDDAEGEDDDDHLEKVLHSEPTSTTLSPTTSPHSEQICE